jgi:hypothetical protein
VAERLSGVCSDDGMSASLQRQGAQHSQSPISAERNRGDDSTMCLPGGDISQFGLAAPLKLK